MDEKTLTAFITLSKGDNTFFEISVSFPRNNITNGTEIGNYLDNEIEKQIKNKKILFPEKELEIKIELTDTKQSDNIQKKNIDITFKGSIEKHKDFLGLVGQSIGAALRAMDCSADVEIT
jgi:hypothetical protein